MKQRFLVFGHSLNDRIGTKGTMDSALLLIKKNGGNGNILELNDDGEVLKTYGIKKNKISVCRRQIKAKGV